MRIGNATSALVLIVACAGAAKQRNDGAILAGFAKHGCNPRISYLWIGPDSITRAEACILATTALDHVGQGGARGIGVQPGDTANLSRVAVSQISMATLGGGPIDSYWLVQFELPARKPSLAVTIDRVTGKLQARLSEHLNIP